MIELTRDEWEKIKMFVFENLTINGEININHEEIDELAQNSGLIKIKKTALEKARELSVIILKTPQSVCQMTRMNYHQAVEKIIEEYEEAIKEAQEKNKSG